MTRPFIYGGEFVAYAGNPPWVVKDGISYMVTAVADDRVCVATKWVRMDTLAREYTFLDGKPCGVEVS